MAEQFDNFIALAKRLIAKSGRDVTLLQETSTPADATKPWRVTASTATAPLTGVKAVFIDYEDRYIGSRANPDSAGGQAREFELIRRGDKKCLIAADDAVIQQVSILDYSLIVDGGVQWVVINIKPLQPGIHIIMYEIQVRKL